MFLTVCIPTYNRGYIISRPLDSLLQQEDKDFECIIVDDGSTDNTKEIVGQYMGVLPIKYIYKPNGGKHTALNVGISNAVGDYFMILDSDDALENQCIARMKSLINSKEYKEKNAVGCMGKCAQLGNKENVIGDSFNKQFISYIDFHFRDGKSYGDCCECIKTEIIKNYKYPESKYTKFVPESYVFDQMGQTVRKLLVI
jgi:glycosyltransferase involved in cell wall biosynthesis